VSLATPALELVGRQVAAVRAPRRSSTPQDVSVSSDVSDASGGAHRAQRRQCRRAATKQRVPERQRLQTTPAVKSADRRVADDDALRPRSTSKDFGVSATSATPVVEPVERRVADADAPRPSSASQDVSDLSDASGGACRAPHRRRRRAAAKQRAQEVHASSGVSDASGGARRAPRQSSASQDCGLSLRLQRCQRWSSSSVANMTRHDDAACRSDVSVGATSAAPAVEPVERRVADADRALKRGTSLRLTAKGIS
jgi:hypothetical protein